MFLFISVPKHIVETLSALYLHIPFCRSRCVYCDFCSSTYGREIQSAYVQALLQELRQRSGELAGGTVSSIYIGGGTPSVLFDKDLSAIFHAIHSVYNIKECAEVTLEANPDDVTTERVRAWKDMGINRLSLGVQSLDDRLLQMLNRRHTSRQAIHAVEAAFRKGLDNVSIDLMYGLPMLDMPSWEQTLELALALPVVHLSAYCLSVERETVMEQKIVQGIWHLPDDELAEAQYKSLISATREAGFEHYEISNFARNGKFSRHNSSYWDGTPYVGLGVGAHSYDGSVRRANTTDVQRYAQSNGNVPYNIETLSKFDQINEMLFLSLRTSRGLNLSHFKKNFGEEVFQAVIQQAHPHIVHGRLKQDGDTLRLTEAGIFVSNDVLSDLLIVD